MCFLLPRKRSLEKGGWQKETMGRKTAVGCSRMHTLSWWNSQTVLSYPRTQQSSSCMTSCNVTSFHLTSGVFLFQFSSTPFYFLQYFVFIVAAVPKRLLSIPFFFQMTANSLLTVTFGLSYYGRLDCCAISQAFTTEDECACPCSNWIVRVPDV